MECNSGGSAGNCIDCAMFDEVIGVEFDALLTRLLDQQRRDFALDRKSVV